MDEERKPHLLVGALTGLLITPPLMAMMYLAEGFAGMPFVPFDLFDRTARLLPGPVVTFGIDTMVSVLIRLGLGGDLSTNAKISERLIALSMFLMLGIVVSAAFFFIMNRLKNAPRDSYVPGVICGLIFGMVLTAISFGINVSASADPLLRLVWLLVLFAGWGAALGWVYNVLSGTTQKIKQRIDGGTEISVFGIDRRQFLIRLGGTTATMTVIGAGLGSIINGAFATEDETAAAVGEGQTVALTDGSGNPLPNAKDAVLPAPGTRLEYTPVERFYRIDIVSGALPEIDAAGYTLPITGAVKNPVNWTLDEIRAMPKMDAYLTQSCISNPVGGSLISTLKWTGVSFQYILDQIQPNEDARALKITGADGFDEYVMLDTIREDERVMLAYDFDDKPLPPRNGFPLRTHIPNRYGMKQPKWITNIEVVTAAETGEGYWVRRGWSREALVRATSVIDTVAADSAYSKGAQYFVPVGGIAWAGARGISKVEVRVNGGDWQEAMLRSPMSERSWVLWRYDLPYTEGYHTFEVRCVEGDGTPQIESVAGVRPDGATGLHSTNESLNYPA